MRTHTATYSPLLVLLPQAPHYQLLPDPWDRDVGYSPSEGELADPRLLITGRDTEAGTEPGLFDRGSWQETLGKWATTVIAGRAKLGGYPIGIIAVETRTQVFGGRGSVRRVCRTQYPNTPVIVVNVLHSLWISAGEDPTGRPGGPDVNGHRPVTSRQCLVP